MFKATSVCKPLLVLAFACSFANPSSAQIEIKSAVTKIVESADTPAERAGVLKNMTVKEGQFVTKGELLGKIIDDGARMKYDRARFEYAIADRLSKDQTLVKYAAKSLDVTRAELARSESANRSVNLAVSDTELDHLRLIVSKAKLEVEKSQLEFEVAKLNKQLREVDLKETKFELSRHEIRSPINGQVVMIHRRPGEWIETGQVAFRIVRIDRLRVEGWVGVEEASQGLENRPVDVTIHVPNRDDVVRTGTIVFVSPEANPVDGKILVWAEIDNEDRKLRPGLRADIVVKPQNSEQASR